MFSGSVDLEAPAKVNLCLHVSERDTSGYHGVVTLLQTLALADRVRVEVVGTGGVRLDVERADLGPPAANLAVRAARAFLAASGGTRGSVHIRLEKHIPAGAGLGGGSSDAAATLLALNALFGAPLPRSRLLDLARTLGSDVPFFLCESTLGLGTGHGADVRAIPALPVAPVVLALPALHISTADAYRALDEHQKGAFTTSSAAREHDHPCSPEDLTRVASWIDVERLRHNDFEAVVLAAQPEVARARDALESTRPRFVLLSGSGAAVYAVYGSEDDARRALELQGAVRGVHFVLTRTRASTPTPIITR